jgi:hypothetical protein
MLWILTVPQRLCVEGLVTTLWHYCEVVEPLGGRA